MVVLLLLGGAAWWFSKPYVEAEIIERVQAAAAQHGLTVELPKVEWNRSDTIRVPAMRIERGEGMGISLQDVDVTVSMHALLKGDLQVDRLSIGSAQAHGTLEMTERAGRGGLATLEGIKSLRPPWLAPWVQPEIDRFSLDLRDGKGTSGHVSGRRPTIELDPTQLSVRLDATLTLGRPDLPAPVRRAVHIEALVARGDQRVEVTAQGAQALFEQTIEPHGAIRVDGVRARRQTGQLTLEASTVAVRLGPEAAPVLALTADQARRQTDGTIVFAQGVAELGKDPRAVPGYARAFLTALRGERTTRESAAQVEKIKSKRSVRLEGFTIRSQPEVDLMTAARIETDGTQVRFQGQVGGGSASGRWQPGTLALTAEGVRWDGALRDHGVGGRFSGTLELHKTPLRLVVDGKVSDGHVEHPALAPEPIRGIAAGFAGTIEAHDGVFAFKDARVRVGAAEATTSLRITGLPKNLLDLKDGWPKGLKPVVDLRLTGDPIRCQQAIDALPAALLGPLQSVRLAGFFRPKIRLRLPFSDPKGVRLETQGISKGGCDVVGLTLKPEARSAVDVAAPLDDVLWLDADFILPVREGVSAGKTIRIGPGMSSYVRLEDMPAYVGGAAYLSEEMGFYSGKGISVPLIAKALGTNLTKGRFAYGGSTVTQQLVKNLFLTRRKTLARKFQEALISARIARAISKDRVLELYLNCIEFGPDLYGIGPAAQHYFQKEARALTPMEAVFLAMLKPAPQRGRWYVRQGRTPRMPYWSQRSRLLLERLEARHLAAPGTAEAAAPYVLKWANGKYLGAIRHMPIAPTHDESSH